MYSVTVLDFETWRDAARQALQSAIAPQDINWTSDAQPALFATSLPEGGTHRVSVPKQYIELAHKASFHRDMSKWALLYRIVWRINYEERQLLRISTDDDVVRLRRMVGEVRRDAHKMKAFVRFREVPDYDNAYIAWHEPSHLIVPYTAPFFTRRFTAMRWAILTPDASAYWDGNILHYGEGVPRDQAPKADDMESLWTTFYRNIFNPARIKTDMMRSEMPQKYWHTMPETALIPSMLEESDARLKQMLENQSS